MFHFHFLKTWIALETDAKPYTPQNQMQVEKVTFYISPTIKTIAINKMKLNSHQKVKLTWNSQNVSCYSSADCLMASIIDFW